MFAFYSAYLGCSSILFTIYIVVCIPLFKHNSTAEIVSILWFIFFFGCKYCNLEREMEVFKSSSVQICHESRGMLEHHFLFFLCSQGWMLWDFAVAQL